jgi:uncharacterized membrane protein YkvA (DUF1232 family)
MLADALPRIKRGRSAPGLTNRLLSRKWNCSYCDAMKKTKAKKRTVKKTPKPRTKTEARVSLKERLEAEFAQAVWDAKSYVNNPPRLRALFHEAAKQAMSLPKEPFKDTWPYLQTMLRLIRAYANGEYRAVTEMTLVVIIAAVIYVVSPLDVIPDAIPAIGFLDDATVLALAVKRTREDLDALMMWETTAP